MTPVSSKLYADDVSLLMVLIDTNPFFWNSAQSTLPFSKFLTHVLAFLNSILLLNKMNQVVVIAAGYNSCGYIFDSSDPQNQNKRAEDLLHKLEEFVDNDQEICREESVDGPGFSLLSGSLSMALCCILFFLFIALRCMDVQLNYANIFRGSFEQCHFILSHGYYAYMDLQMDLDSIYVAIMNSIFSAQRSMNPSVSMVIVLLADENQGQLQVPIDSCVLGAQHSAFLQQASYITGGVYLKPQIFDGLFQYLSTVFATDLHSRCFLQLPKPAGVDFRASCFCHKNTIDMGYICSVCLSIFCKHQKKCSTCGSVFGQAQTQNSSTTPDRKMKTPVDG
ncbi:hypothetical protein SASPL_114791 [Salvia splendens]|uniref:General transcription and DNA repair factor IIH subunit TFB4 n=1 Tax=Salvia splendens TaxID=180675 RepID=A0A8X8Y4D4_SALSN|nr:hypothetical protein SASPL_114791 [Salvia splendens]